MEEKKSLLFSLLLSSLWMSRSLANCVYHHSQGKTLLRFTVHSVICTPIISFMSHTLKSSSLHTKWKSYAPIWLCRFVHLLNAPRHRWKYLAVGFFLSLSFPSSVLSLFPSLLHAFLRWRICFHTLLHVCWQRQTASFKQRGGWYVLICCVCVCVHACHHNYIKQKEERMTASNLSLSSPV